MMGQTLFIVSAHNAHGRAYEYVRHCKICLLERHTACDEFALAFVIGSIRSDADLSGLDEVCADLQAFALGDLSKLEAHVAAMDDTAAASTAQIFDAALDAPDDMTRELEQHTCASVLCCSLLYD